MTKYYTIYQTTNLINRMIYVGMHSTDNLEDRYLGSGKLIQKAIQEFGRENFKKEILFIFDNKEEMMEKERELVNEKFLQRTDVYNISLGGISRGNLGKKLTDETKEKIRCSSIGRKVSEETRQLIREKRKLQIFSEETRKRMGEASKNRIRGPRSQETKEKISIVNKGKSKPPRTLEHREHLSQINLGKVLTIEHREKISKAKKGKCSSSTLLNLRRMAEERRGTKRDEKITEKIRKAKVIKKINTLIFGIIASKENNAKN